MGQPANSPDRLEATATRAPEDRHGGLVHHVANLFLMAPDRYTAREIDQFSDILCLGVGALSLEDRADLALRFAHCQQAPRSFMNVLARDEIAVADPVLAHSAVLNEVDLLALLAEHDECRSMAIGARENLPAAVSAALAALGHPDVLVGLAENTSAKLTRDTMAQLSNAAAHLPAMQLPLIDRDDLDMDLLAQMFLFVSPVLRRRILQTVASDPTWDFASPQEPSPRSDITPPECQADEASLLAAVEARDAKQFKYIFSHLTGLPSHSVDRVLMAPGAQCLAVACKAAGIAKETFCALVLRATETKSVVPEAVAEALAIWDSVPSRAAHGLIGFWRLMPAPQTDQRAAAMPA